jgi:AcrR family transcriptional regulator
MPESSRDRLIAVADRLFYEFGFHAIGLDRIIAEVGVTKTTFYNHFESKDALILAVLDARDRREFDDWVATVRARADGDPRGQLLAMWDVLDEWFTQEEYRGCLFLNAAAQFPAPTDPIHLAAGRHGARLSEELRRLCERAGASDPDSLARQLMLVMSGAIVTRHAALARDAAAVARAAAQLLIDKHVPAVV